MNNSFEMNKPKAVLKLAIVSSVLVMLGACASVPAPTAQMAVAEAAVKRASTVSTAESAPGELQLAKGKLANAQEAMKNKDYARARRLAEQAEVDAQVAELQAQSVRTNKSAAETQDAARVLNEEINRKTVR